MARALLGTLNLEEDGEVIFEVECGKTVRVPDSLQPPFKVRATPRGATAAPPRADGDGTGWTLPPDPDLWLPLQRLEQLRLLDSVSAVVPVESRTGAPTVAILARADLADDFEFSRYFGAALHDLRQQRWVGCIELWDLSEAGDR